MFLFFSIQRHFRCSVHRVLQSVDVYKRQAVNGGYSYTYNMAPTGEQTVQFKSVQPDSREQIVISAPGFNNATIAVDNYLAANIGVSGELRAVYNGLTYTLQSRSATSSNTSIINNFTTNRSSMYNICLLYTSRCV